PCSRLIEQEVIDGVGKGVAHAGGDEDVNETVAVKVADARAPRPPGFNSHFVGNLDEFASSEVFPKGIAKNVVRGTLQVGLGPFDFAEFLGLNFFTAVTRTALHLN